MPRIATVPDAAAALIARQDGIVTRTQLDLHAIGRGYVAHRLASGRWQTLLSGVLMTTSGHPTRRQRLISAHLWAGTDSAIDGPCAAVSHGLEVPEFRSDKVHVVVPNASGSRTTGFVLVRRTRAPIQVGARTCVPYVDVATACLVTARYRRDVRAATALLARGLQQGHFDVDDLRRSRAAIRGLGCAVVDRALDAVGAGLRSPAEVDARALIARSARLPELEWNVWLRLPDNGPPVCVDALWRSAALVHEVNGRQYHAWGSAFDKMQRRHDRLTAAGFIVLHNTPAGLRDESAAVIAEIERSFQRWDGRGLPTGVEILGHESCA